LAFHKAISSTPGVASAVAIGTSPAVGIPFDSATAVFFPLSSWSASASPLNPLTSA